MYERIKRLCELHKISVSQLEIEIKSSSGTICRWDKNRPNIDKVFAVAQYFNVSMEYLLTGEEVKQPTVSGELSEFAALFKSLSETEQESVLVILRGLAQQKAAPGVPKES